MGTAPDETGPAEELHTASEYREILLRLAQLRAVEARPQPIDPTANVLSLVAAAIERQDDLRRVENRRLDDLRSQERYFNERLSVAESNRINSQALAESRRIDALLAAATNNVALAAEKQSAQAATLATQVTSSAEALRAQVAATATQTATSIATLRDSMDKRLSDVEQRQYQSGGRDLQRTEGRQGNQWATSQLVTVAAALAAFALGLYTLLR